MHRVIVEHPNCPKPDHVVLAENIIRGAAVPKGNLESDERKSGT